MLVTAAPCALLWPAALLLWGPGFTASKHKHHCVQLILSLDAAVRIRSGPGRKWIRCSAAFVRPDAPHELDARGGHMLLAFVEAESDLGVALLERIESDISVVPDNTVFAWRERLGSPQALRGDQVERWVRENLPSERRAPRIHPAVRRVLRVLRNEIGSGDNFSLARMASIADLSPSRFLHVFTESVGVPLRPYIRWLRLQIACGEMTRGVKIADAAYRAGFADTSHLTRTLRRMMGMAPSELVGRLSAMRLALSIVG